MAGGCFFENNLELGPFFIAVYRWLLFIFYENVIAR